MRKRQIKKEINKKEINRKANPYGKFLLAAVCAAGTIALCQAAYAAEPELYTATDFAMDTVVTESIYTTGEDVTGEIGTLLRKIESDWLSWTQEDSMIARINASEGQTMEVPDQLASYLEKVMQLSENSNGALDPTLGKVIRLWDIGGENPHIPDEDELKQLLALTGYEKVHLEGNKITLDEGCTLDLGAVGKGIGCAEITDYLQKQQKITAGLVNLGGSSVLTYGTKPDGSKWQIAITDPRETEGDYLGAVALDGGEFLSTSGDYEKYFMEDGVRYHHILDPETGYPANNGVCSVTVVCDDAVAADGLSTTCFILGMEKSQSLLEKYNAEALFVDEDHHVTMTDGMKERFRLLKDSYTVKELQTD